MANRFEQDAEARFVDVEAKVAFQEKMISDLNEVIIQQDRALTKLRRQVKTLEEQLQALLAGVEQPSEQPPHY